jgi:beta-galactosidase/beta-glucuronidase
MNLISTIKSFFNYFTLYAGGGGSAPTNQNVTTTSIPEYARPYVEKMLGKAYDVTDFDKNPYQAYTGQRTAAFTPMQSQAFQNVAGMQSSPQLTDASNLAYNAGQQGMNAGNAYRQQATSADAMGQYMSPYMQNVVDVQSQEARRQADITRQGTQAQAVRSGAFGGSRSAIVQAEADRNLATQLGDIQARGSQSAFEKAQQAQQFGANLGLQGINAANQAAGQLGQLGQTQFGQEQAITDAQMRAGTLQRQEEQAGLDQLYQQFMAEQNYPMEQLGQFSNILRGLPLNQQTQSTYQNPSGISQAAGLGTAAYGLYQMGRKNGGQIRASDGLDTLGLYNAMRKG